MHVNSLSHGATQSPTAAANAKASESLEQLAAEGDPTAIAELKAEQLQAHPTAAGHNAPQTVGASEPGKGTLIDATA